jgi:hypothetical protein
MHACVLRKDSLLEQAELLFITNATFSIEKGIDERIWNIAFYTSIERLRRQLNSVSKKNK